MPMPLPSLRATALAVLPLALLACRSEPPPARSEPPPAQGALRRGVRAHSGRVTRGALARRQAHRGTLLERGRAGGVRGVAHAVREVNHLTRIAPETVVHALGWSGDGVLVVGYEQPDTSGEREVQSRTSPDGVVYDVGGSVRERREGEREYRMVGMRVGSRRRQRSRDPSWPLEVHPLLPGGVIHWRPDDPERVLINWWKSSEIGASALLARVRDGSRRRSCPRRAG